MSRATTGRELRIVVGEDAAERAFDFPATAPEGVPLSDYHRACAREALRLAQASRRADAVTPLPDLAGMNMSTAT